MARDWDRPCWTRQIRTFGSHPLRAGPAGMAMFEAGGVSAWRGHDVAGSDGRKTGTLEPVYGDTGTDEPASGTVTVGLAARCPLAFVPLAGRPLARAT